MLVTRLMGSYTSSKMPDGVYMSELMATLLQYPFGVGERGLNAACKESPQFIPNIPQIVVECDKLFGRTREASTYAREWQARTAAQLGEREEFERGPRPTPKDDRPPHSRANVFIARSTEVQSHYDKAVERASKPNADPLDFYYGNREGRAGIWVSLGWVENLMHGRAGGLQHVSKFGAPV